MALLVKAPLLHDRKEGAASESAQQLCGEQKNHHLADPASGSWFGTWLAPAGPSVGPLPAGHAIPASKASQPSHPTCRWAQITKQNNVRNISKGTVLHLGFLKTPGLCCGVTQSTVNRPWERDTCW